MTAISYTNKPGTPISTLNFRENNQLVIISYILRAVGAVIFGGLFFVAANVLHPQAALTLDALVSIAIEGVPDIVSIGLIVLAVMLVLSLHELVHAFVFFVHTGAPPHIGMRGAIIFASAEGFLNTRNTMIVNALAPFVVISLAGLLLMAITPLSTLAWIFIPTVANAAAAGGDFMAVSWLLSLPKNAMIEDHGDILIACDYSN